MKIAVLTSSRADYGIYRPLLRRLEGDSFFELSLIVFGTHTSPFHGSTIRTIREDGYRIDHVIETQVLGDSPEAIASSMSLTIAKFSGIWTVGANKYDLIICLGDRYEMFAAVGAAVPFNLPFAHVHGGEQTLGAIDNRFRDCLTHMSDVHFTTTETYRDRVARLTESRSGSAAKIYNVGSLSLDNLDDVDFLSNDELSKQLGINLSRPTILFTFHPETVHPERNSTYIDRIISVLKKEKRYQIVITMPNADTSAHAVRERLVRFAEEEGRAVFVESLGTRAYFSCMQHCSFVMGNSSSGIIEAASLGCYVINLGDRQKGRIAGDNVMHVPVETEKMTAAIKKIESLPPYEGSNPYWNGGAADKIIGILKEHF